LVWKLSLLARKEIRPTRHSDYYYYYYYVWNKIYEFWWKPFVGHSYKIITFMYNYNYYQCKRSSSIVVGRVVSVWVFRRWLEKVCPCRYDNDMMYACYVIYFVFLSVSEWTEGWVVRRIPSRYRRRLIIVSAIWVYLPNIIYASCIIL